MKQCTTCNETKELADFYAKGAGKAAHCKLCDKERRAANYAKHRAADRVAITSKVCSRCDTHKDADEFGDHSGAPDGKKGICLQCTRSKLLRERYGITLAKYDEMLCAQAHTCAICGIHESEYERGRLHVDHCHETGAVRGLLCHHCNLMLGNAKDDTAALAAAIIYLETNT